MTTPDYGKQWHQSQLSNVDAEIAKLATICDIRILEPGIIERVIKGDESVCGRKSEKAFRSLSGLVKMHYALTDDSLKALGPEESVRMLDEIRARLRTRYDLGGSR
jgi:hypothetical protein